MLPWEAAAVIGVIDVTVTAVANIHDNNLLLSFTTSTSTIQFYQEVMKHFMGNKG